MSFQERIYRILLWLYPAKHRREYGRLMLQHAGDMGRAVEEGGRGRIFRLCFSLVIDGIVNACKEHVEGLTMANNKFKPFSWRIVVLAALPGLLVALTRSKVEALTPVLTIVAYVYGGVLILGVPIVWWRRRQFPVWALLPAGLLVWVLTFYAGQELLRQLWRFWLLIGLGSRRSGIFPLDQGEVTALLNLVLAAVIFLAILRGRRSSSAIWLIFGGIVLGNIALAAGYAWAEFGDGQLLKGILRYFTASGLSPLEGLMFVAVGLLAARKYGVLAFLVLVGGYSYMCLDTDYLFGNPYRDWPGMPPYLIAVTTLYLVVVPVTLLRAKNRWKRALGVFVPLVAFHGAIFFIPRLVIQEPILLSPGDVVWIINIMLLYVFAWLLYSQIGDESYKSNSDYSLLEEARYKRQDA